MAYARRRTPEIRRPLEIKQGVLNYLLDIPVPEGDSETLFEVFALTAGDEQGLRELWRRARGEVLAAWAKKHPGSRPSTWWRFDTREPRQQLAGVGCPAWVVLADAECYASGLPQIWAGYEPSNPPVFESQAEYLRRHKLLTAAELRVLTKNDYKQTEELDASCAIDLGPFEGPDAEGVRWLNEWGARIRERIPAARN